MLVKSWRWPCFFAKPFLLRFLKVMSLLPLPCFTISAVTLAPAIVGVPTFRLSPSPTANTSESSILAPTSPGSFSMFTTSPSFTLYCFPPVFITAVDGHYTRHDVGEFDLVETGLFHHRRERGLVGMHADRLGEVAVA